MTHPRRHRLLAAAGGAALLLGGLQASDAPPRLDAATPLHATPGGPPDGSLGVGTPVRVLAEQEGWVLVQAEGWIPAAALAAAGGPAAPQGAAAGAAESADSAERAPAAGSGTPAAAAPGVAASSSGAIASAVLEGTILVPRRRGREQPAAGAMVVLLPPDTVLDGGGEEEEDVARLVALADEADDLKRRADRAMTQDSFSKAVQDHDRLMAEREGVLAEWSRLAAQVHGRHEAAARAAAVASTRADDRGFYTLDAVPPGRYLIYARLVGEDEDVEWLAPVQVGSDRTRRDLGRDEIRMTAAP